MASIDEGFPERRRHKRIRLRLRGRYLLSDGSEFPCETINVSPSGIALRAHLPGNMGERVVAYIDELGRVEGEVVRRGDGWFAIDARTSQNKIDRIVKRIAMLLSPGAEGDGSDRSDAPQERSILRTADGHDVSVHIVDATTSEATIRSELKLAFGTRVTLDGEAGHVDRCYDWGFTVTFDKYVT